MSEADSVAGRKILLEAALLSADRPLATRELVRLFAPETDEDHVRKLLDDLRADWQERGVVLNQLAEGWRFQTNPRFQPQLNRLKAERPPRYSRATLETLAIIAYRQPLTRGEIEDVRGVAISSGIIKTLESRGWIEVVGHRNTPGQPALYATTPQFLNDLMLRSLDELPPLPEMTEALDSHPAGALLASPAPESTPATMDEPADENPAPATDDPAS